MENHANKWHGKPVVAGVLRVFITVAPIALSILFVFVLARVFPRPNGWVRTIAWWVILSIAATAVLIVLDRLFRKLLPVVALFKLSLVFPDKAPSRFNSALRTGTVRQLKRRMESGEFSKVAPQEAAEQLVGLASALNAHDRLTRGHTERVRAYSVMIGEELGLDEEELEFLNWSGLIHDIGKLSVPTEILNKAGKPDAEEWRILRDHPAKADLLVEPLRPWLGEWAESATQHHERYDGEGYPNGIEGRNITLAGRIVAVADAYDVMTSTRSYKTAMPAEEARKELAVNAGSQFDPDIVRAFLGVSIGRLRLVAGPLASLIQFPVGGASVGTVATTGASAVTAMSIAAFSGVLAPPVEVAAPPSIPETVAMTIEAPDLEVTGSEDNVLIADFGDLTAIPGIQIQMPTQLDEGDLELADDGIVVFTPDPNFNGTIKVAYSACIETDVCDEGSISFVVASVNDEPVTSNDSFIIDEDTAGVADVLANDSDVDGDRLVVAAVRLADDPDEIIDVVEIGSDGISVAVQGAPNRWGTALVEYTVADPSGATASAVLVVNITPVNDAPEAFDDSVTTVENTTLTIDVLANDVDVDDGTLRIVSISDVVGGSAATDGRRLVFAPSARFIGAGSLTYAVEDPAGLTASARVYINVVDDPDRPALAADSANALEDQSVVVDVLANDPNPEAPLDAAELEVSTQPANGTAAVVAGGVKYTPDANWSGVDSFRYFVCDTDDFCDVETVTVTVGAVNDAPSFATGPDIETVEGAPPQTINGWATAIVAGPADESGQVVSFAVTASDPSLFSVQPAISPTGDLTFTPAADANGAADLTITLGDDGRTLNGGIDTSPVGSATVSVTPVNDPPSFVPGANPTVAEDSGATLLAGWATALSPGPASEAGQTLSFVLTAADPGLFSVQPAISPTGDLTFTPAPDKNGATDLTIVLSDSGGTAGGGVDTAPPVAVSVTIDPVNDPPSFLAGPDITVLEDSPTKTVAGWATGITAGPTDEVGQSVSFSVVAADPSLFSVQPAISPAGDLTFSPAADADASSVITVTAVDTGDTAGGGVDTSAPVNATITMTPVNDAPSFDAGASLTVLEDSGPVVISSWATSLSPGPTSEVGQTLAFDVVVADPSLFSVPPTISPAGDLSFIPGLDVNGTTDITITLSDSGGATDGGVDSSAPVTVTVTIDPVNDAPSFVPGADVAVAEDSGAQAVAGWATAISVGPPDEASQVPTFAVTVTDPTLFSVQPAISASGELTFTTAADANGAADLTITLSDDGGTVNGGIDISAPASATITVAATNDPPVAADDSGAGLSTLEDTAFTTIDVAANDVDIDDPIDPGTIVVVTPPASGTLTDNGNGTFDYLPNPNFFGTDTFTYTISDPTPSVSNVATVTIDVISDNDAPVAAADSGPSYAAWSDRLFTTPDVTANDSDIDDPVDPASAAIVTPPATGTLTNNGDGTFDFSPAPGWTGTETFTYSISDASATSNAATVTIVVQPSPVADAGGPYTITEGDDLGLDASASTNSPTSYNWDLDNDGAFDDASGVNPTVPWATLVALGLADDGTYPVGLEINGGFDTATTNLIIENFAPVLTTSGASNVTAGAPYTLNLSSFDPGDDLISEWTINWGDGTIVTISGNPSSVTHTYTRAGFTFEILVSATDEDGTFLQNELLVPSYNRNSFFRFEATSGAFLGEFAGPNDPIEAIIGPDGLLYISGEQSDDVQRYDAKTGAFIDVFVPTGSGGLNQAEGLAFGPDGHLYVADSGGDNILRFDGVTGAFIDTFVPFAFDPYDIIFGPDSNMYVGSYTGDLVWRFDGVTGAFIDTFVLSSSGGLDKPEQMVFGPDGHLYVASFGSHEVLRYDGTTGNFIDAFVPAGGVGDLDDPTGVAFGPDGHLYVGDFVDDAILRFDGLTGAFIDQYVPDGTGGLTDPDPMTFLGETRVRVDP